MSRKPVVGASLVQRLETMEALAAAAEPAGSILCGVTAHPLVVDKAAALHARRDGVRIIVLVGFDTWVRIVEPKYYAPGGRRPPPDLPRRRQPSTPPARATSSRAAPSRRRASARCPTG